MIKGIIRRGMWVEHKSYIGILNDFAVLGDKKPLSAFGNEQYVIPENHGEVHYVNEEGETVEVAMVPLKEITDAMQEDIPRRKGFNVKSLQRYPSKKDK